MKEVPFSTTFALTEDVIEGTVIWLFWRKVLKLRNYKPVFRVVNIYKTTKNIRSVVCYYFERPADKKMLMVSISKNNGIYFTVAKSDEVFESKVCYTVGQFEEEFKNYFRRVLPIMPPGVGTLPGNKY